MALPFSDLAPRFSQCGFVAQSRGGIKNPLSNEGGFPDGTTGFDFAQCICSVGMVSTTKPHSGSPHNSWDVIAQRLFRTLSRILSFPFGHSTVLFTYLLTGEGAMTRFDFARSIYYRRMASITIALKDSQRAEKLL